MAFLARGYARPLAWTAGAGAVGYAAWTQYAPSTRAHPFFDLPVKSRGPNGEVHTTMKRIPYLAREEAERRLTANAFSSTVPRAGSAGGTWRFDTAYLASNDPIEDAHAEAVIRPLDSDFWGRKGNEARDVLFFAIMDGHSGYNTSRLLSKTLIPSVALELQGLAPLSAEATSPATKRSWSLLGYLKSYLPFMSAGPQTPSILPYPFDSDVKYVQTAIQTAFANLDSQIINAPIQAVTLLEQTRGGTKDQTTDSYGLTIASLLPALSGSCALLAMLDASHNDLHVACTGDSRAVVGYWETDDKGSGKWRVEVLTDDQTGRNPSEVKRMQSEHPSDEAHAVIQRGRVFGGLEPTRAFGDARYKWPKEFQQKLLHIFDKDSPITPRTPPNDLKTPPYVTARPVLTHRKLPFGNSSDPNLRFLVMATDGLWEKLSSSEVVSLVGAYLQRVSPTGSTPAMVPKATLALTTVETPLPPGTIAHANEPPISSKAGLDDGWAFVDKNVATHLIRNALGGANERKVDQLLSIPAPLSRRYRDDLTVTVVWWEDRQDALKYPVMARL